MRVTLRIQRLVGLVVCVAIVGFVSTMLVLRFIRFPIAVRMNTFPDDSFYYMVPALNIAKGLGPTADTITRTSGYHPLWMAVLSLLARLCDCDRLTYFNVVLIAGMTLHAATALLIYLAAVRFVPPVHAVIWSVIFLTVERGFLDALGGVEACLVTACLGILLWLDASRSVAPLRMIARGVCLGLLFLARTDSFIFIAAYFLVHGGFMIATQRDARSLVRILGPVAAGTVLTCLPWVLISWWTYGTVFQGSQVAKQFWRARLLEHSSTREALVFSLSLFRSWLTKINALYPPRLSIVLAFLAGIAFLRLLEKPRPEQLLRADAEDAGRSLLNLSMIVIALMAYVVGAGLFYATHFPESREWYFAGARVLWVALGILLCALAFHTPRKRPRRVLQTASAFVLVLIATSTVRGAMAHPLGRDADARGPRQFVMMADYINTHLPHDAIIGAYSSGVLSYFSDRRVINLDGLNNNDIVEVARARAMDVYLDAKGARYVADHESIVRPARTVGFQIDSRPGFIERLREIHRVPVPAPSAFGDIVLWEVMPVKRHGESR